MSDPDLSTLGKRLQWAREQLDPKLSARALADLAGIADAHVGMIERGEVLSPQLDTLTKIAGVLGLTLDWLMSGRGALPRKRASAASVERARAARAEHKAAS